MQLFFEPGTADLNRKPFPRNLLFRHADPGILRTAPEPTSQESIICVWRLIGFPATFILYVVKNLLIMYEKPFWKKCDPVNYNLDYN